MGQEQSVPQNLENGESTINKEINNIFKENKNDKASEEKIQNKITSNDVSSKLSENENHSEIGNSMSYKSLSNTSLNENYKNPMVSINTLMKSYRSSKEFFSMEIIENLMKISSSTKYLSNNEIWEILLKKEKLPIINTKQTSFDLNIIVNFIGAEMAANNDTTKNFQRLVINLISELKYCNSQEYKNDINLGLRNSLYLIKLFSKYFIENITAEEIEKLFDSYEPSDIIPDDVKDEEKPHILLDDNIINAKKSKLELLIEELFNVLIYLPQTNEKNEEFYDEILNTLIIFSASRFHNDIENNDNHILTTMFKVLSEQENENLAGKVITKLLLNLMYSNDQKGGLFNRVLKKNSTNLSSMARKSLYIFLILTNQPNQLAKNKLSNLVNELSNTTESGDLSYTNAIDLNISFQTLYTLIHDKLCDNEEMCLLLYQLVSQNSAFRSFVLSKIDPELLLLPLLESLYTSFREKTNFNKVYIILITLLIMSQDEIYTETLQRIEINHPSWFMENHIKKISLSNFTLLILLKIIQINLGKYKDIYLHSNCLAILTNITIKMVNIHYYSAQKLIGLLDLVQKKYFKLKSSEGSEESKESQNEDNMELQIDEDLIMLLLEIINACLINSLKTNLQLVYSVMRDKEIFINMKDIERFKEPIENIIYTIDFFESKIVFEEDLPSSDEVMQQIVEISKSWVPDKLKKTELIKFKFEEEKDYSKFFLPYIFNMIYSNTIFYNC